MVSKHMAIRPVSASVIDNTAARFKIDKTPTIAKMVPTTMRAWPEVVISFNSAYIYLILQG